MRTPVEVELRAMAEELARIMFFELGSSPREVSEAIECNIEQARRLRQKLNRRPVRVALGITPAVNLEESAALLSCRGLLAMLVRAAEAK